jgi:hypothetical protein
VTILPSKSARSAEAAEYRRCARSCRKIADRTPTEEHKVAILRLAEACKPLVRETEEALTRRC